MKTIVFLVTLSLLFLIFGCSTQQDQVTINILNERISALERTQQQKLHTYVIITNPNGSKTSVRLKIDDGKYIGPSNEIYDKLPSPSDLLPYYGLSATSETIRRTSLK